MLPTKNVAILCLLTAFAALAQTSNEIVLHNFSNALQGAFPDGGVIRDASGNLYTTASQGGTNGFGVVFKVSPTGHETVLYTFTFPGIPEAGLVADSSGNLYGTSTFDGAYGGVFKLDSSGNATYIHNFNGLDGATPYAPLTRDAAGNLYGTTSEGGWGGYGVVFKIDAAGNYTMLYQFTGGADGCSPYAGLVLDSAGNLYGTTNNCGAADSSFGSGVVFKIDTAGHETVLYTFTGGTDGANPMAGLFRDSAGNLYGTTSRGGAGLSGVVFKLDNIGHYSVLYSFGTAPDGGFPLAGVVRDAAGNLYGTTNLGGAAGFGTVYKVDATGHETVLYSFKSGIADGAYPYAGVILDASGNLYGTTEQGGAGNVGIVFKVSQDGHETVLCNLPGAPGGSSPASGVTRDSAGNFYGTTRGGGAGDVGVVYKMDRTGHETVLYNFTGGADGGDPSSGVVRDSAGNLFGTTHSGGSLSADNPYCGVLYKLDPSGHQTVLHAFTCGADGAFPEGPLARDAEGNIYGTTYAGGSGQAGVVYKYDTTGNFTVLFSFTNGPDGGSPQAGVILDGAGNLYGTASGGGLPHGTNPGWGVVFKLDPAGHETVLYSFSNGADGSSPNSPLYRDAGGNLYGTTSATLYEVDPSGHETVLYNFFDSYPQGGLIRDTAGNFYGTTKLGGTSGNGVVYKLDIAGNVTVLYNFTGGADGGQPQSGVIRDSQGNLFGTAYIGGADSSGVLFKIGVQHRVEVETPGGSPHNPRSVR